MSPSGISRYLQVSFTLAEMGYEVFWFCSLWLAQWTLKVLITKLMLLLKAFVRVYEQFREQHLLLIYSLNHQHLSGRKCPKGEAILGPCRWLHSAGERLKKKKKSQKPQRKWENNRWNNSRKPSDCVQHTETPKIPGKGTAVHKFKNLSITCFLKKRKA